MRPQMEQKGCASACGNWAVLGVTGRDPGGSRRLLCSHPRPIHSLPSAELQGSTNRLSIQDPTSQLCIHPFQRASSKQVYTARRKETIAHNHRADSLSFQSSFLKQWGTDASGERTKTALRMPWACKTAETARAGSRRRPPAKQPWCNGALQRPRGAHDSSGQEATQPQGRRALGPGLGLREAGCGDVQERQPLLLQAGRPALMPALELPPARTPKQDTR